MMEDTPSLKRSPKLEKKTTLRRPPDIGARCRRKLESSFNAVDNDEKPVDKTRSKKEEGSLHSIQPRCLSCTDRSPGRLRELAVSICHECKVYLCTRCSRKHRTVSRGNCRLSSISPKKDENFRTRNGHHACVCLEGHKDVPKYYCETCQDGICLHCIETRHKKHQYVYAKDIYGKHRESLEKHVEDACMEVHHIEKQLNHGEDMISELKTVKDEIAKKINDQTKLIMEAIKDKEKDLLQDLERLYLHNEEVLIRSKERLKIRLELIKRTCRFTEIAMQDGDEAQVLIFEKHASKRLGDLCHGEFLSSVIAGDLRYHVKAECAEKAKQLLGKVIQTFADPKHCEVHGQELRGAVVGQNSHFIVNLKGKNESPLTTGGDDVQAQITNTSGDFLKTRVIDHDNGTYTVNFTPKASGVINIKVSVNGDTIKTPDCNVHVICQRDYQRIEEPFLTIRRLILADKEVELKLPCGVAIDNQGRLLIADCHNHSIKVVSWDGPLIKLFGSFGSRNGQLNNPTDIAVDEEDRIYVCDKDNSRVQCFTSKGVFLSKFSSGNSPLKRPWGICIDNKGNVVVADTKNDQIQVFSKDGEFVCSFGKAGNEAREFHHPYFVTAHSNGQIYITDNGNHRVQVFDENYSYLFQFNGTDDLKLKYPTGITTDHEGHVIVADQCNSRLQVYQADGTHKAIISKGLNTSQSLSFPKGLAITQDGFIVVADSDNDRVVLL